MLDFSGLLVVSDVPSPKPLSTVKPSKPKSELE